MQGRRLGRTTGYTETEKEKVATKKAAILDDDQLHRFLDYVSKGKTPERDRVMVLLSFKAALRSAEIAGLDWEDVLDGEGNVGWRTPVAIDGKTVWTTLL